MNIYLRDFLWFLVKENLLVNFLYKYFAGSLAVKRGVQGAEIEHRDIIDKEWVRSHHRDYVRYKWISVKGQTSGTTNSPLVVYRGIRNVLLEEYFFKKYLFENGVGLRSRVAVLRGDHIKDADDISPPYWVKLPFSRRLILSSYHISENTFSYYFQELNKFKPDYIHAYPSSILVLSKYALAHNWKPNWNLTGVFTSSETFREEDIKIVRQVFGKVFDHYGQAERVAALQLCSSDKYHVVEDYSFVEFVHVEKEIYRIIGTNIHNSAMHLVRYDTGDLIEGLHENEPCSCGNNSRYVDRIIGRDDDFVLLPDGRMIGRLDVVFKGITRVAECQIEQVSLDKLVVRCVFLDNFDTSEYEQTKAKVLTSLRNRVGSEISIDIIGVSSITRSKSGKFKSVIRSFDN